jgi:hypothetical protein
MATLFHVAPAASRDEIAAEGLTVQGAEWYEEQTPGVYAWTDEHSAQHCQSEYERLGEAPYDIWSFESSVELPGDPLCFHAVFSPEPIPAATLTLHAKADWSEED